MFLMFTDKDYEQLTDIVNDLGYIEEFHCFVYMHT
jgi:hypothetical protein